MRSPRVREVLATGERLRGGRVIVFVAPGSGQTAVVAARRIGGAVRRNRARRILRAAWQQVVPRIDDRDVVLVAREAIRGATTQDLVTEMTEVLHRGRFGPP